MEVDHSLDAADHRSLVDHSDIPLGRHVGRRAVHFDARRTVHQESLSYSDRIDRTMVDYGAAGLGKKLLGRYHVGVLGSDNPIVGEASGLGEAGEEEDKTAIHEVDYLGRAGPEILGSAGVDSRSNSGGMKKEEGGPLKNGCRQEDDKSAHHRQSMIQHRCWNTRNFGCQKILSRQTCVQRHQTLRQRCRLGGWAYEYSDLRDNFEVVRVCLTAKTNSMQAVRPAFQLCRFHRCCGHHCRLRYRY